MLLPIVTAGQSDSACLDNMIELLTLTGRSLPHVMMMLIPEAWDGNEQMDPVKKAFYEYHASMMEPWDGPASISFTDGKIIGATLDRNGLRPSRYCVTSDDRVIMASETGALPVDPTTVIEKGDCNLVKCSLSIWSRAGLSVMMNLSKRSALKNLMVSG